MKMYSFYNLVNIASYVYKYQYYYINNINLNVSRETMLKIYVNYLLLILF